MADEAFRIDYEYDSGEADRAGGSRFLNYVRLNQGWFDGCWALDDPRADFAATAWRIATAPVMAPGYVRTHPRILTAELQRSDWDSKLLARADLITPAPQALRQSSERGGGRWWRDWPAESLIGREAYYEPGGRELRDDPYMLPSVSLRWALPDHAVLDPPAGNPTLTELQHAAKHCVVALVAELNRTINPVLAQLERS
jgi:hypothetical protein